MNIFKGKKKIYYAHSKMIYGTMQEKEEIALLRKKYKVVDPNNDMGELGNIQPYLRRIEKCDGVVCSEYNGYIGKGVYTEVEHALRLGKFVFCIRKGKLLVVKELLPVDGQDWARRYGKIVC
jgi:hypothetical protein